MMKAIGTKPSGAEVVNCRFPAWLHLSFIPNALFPAGPDEEK
jgi:hypothetical protein